MLKWWKSALLGAMFVAASVAQAHGFQVADLHITHPYGRASLPGVPNASAWFGVRNEGATADRIVGVQSAVAERTELHDMTIENDIMRMFKVDGVDVPAGSTVTLGDGNKLHVMLLGLKEPLKVGDKYTLTIQFEKAGPVDVEVWIEAPKKSGGEHNHDSHGDHQADSHAHGK